MAGGTLPLPPAVLLQVRQPGTLEGADHGAGCGRAVAARRASSPRRYGVYVTDGMFTGGRLLKVG